MHANHCFLHDRIVDVLLRLVKSAVLIGNFETIQHDVSGTVYVDDATTIRIENFHYDGLGPGACPVVSNR